MSESNLDITCSERDAYREKYSWVSYGDYVNKVVPNMTKEQRAEIQKLGEELRANRKKKKRGNKNDKTDKTNKHR